MQLTSIEWTGTPRADGSLEPGFSANPLRYRDESGRVVWACVHASPGCQHCYAESLAKRFGRGGPFNVPTTSKVTPFLDEKELRQILTAKVIDGIDVAGSKVFLGDMTDIFGEWVPDELLDRLFAAMALRPDVTFQILTKRARRMRQWLEINSTGGRIFHVAQQIDPRGVGALSGRWPLPNVWLGVSCEDQQRADDRIPHLLATPSAVRFVSSEPLLGPIDLINVSMSAEYRGITDNVLTGTHNSEWGPQIPTGTRIDWVIVGGESGVGARPFDIAWARSIVEQCRLARVACFVKQLGSIPVQNEDEWRAGDGEGRVSLLSARNHRRTPEGYVPIAQTSRKGGDISEWPADLRVREFPGSAVPA